MPGIIEIDDKGQQYYVPKQDAAFHVLIIGGSVAAGTFATTTAKTYFGQLGEFLEAELIPTKITVLAGGAWKSSQDIAALEYCLRKGIRPNLVIFINGLNDLTNGPTADSLYGQVCPTRDGSRWTALYHSHDYERRTAMYLQNMQAASEMANRLGIAVLIVLQPALFEREPLSNVERQLLAASLPPHKSQAALEECYVQMREQLSQLADNERVFFLDCSRIFNGESATTFADMWHFSDFGHRILAEALTPAVQRALRSSQNNANP